MLHWLVYLLVISTLIGIMALALERTIQAWGLAGRWVWACALAASLALPIVLSSTLMNSPAISAAGRPSHEHTSRSLNGEAQLVPMVSLDIAQIGPAPTHFDSIFELAWWMSSLIVAGVLLGGVWYGNRRHRDWSCTKIDGTDVLVAQDSGPATIGLLRPKIVLPNWLLVAPPEALRLVVAHERSHVEARDNVLLAVGLGFAALMPWNLILWWQVQRLRLAIEVDCDRRVLRDGHNARRYAKTLINVSLRGSAYVAGLSAASKSISSIERRVRIMNTPKLRGWRGNTVALAIIATASAAACFLIAPPAMPLAMASVAAHSSLVNSRQCIGSYRMSSISIMKIELHKGQLVALAAGAPPQPLTRLSGNRYRFGKLNAYVRFVLNRTGHVTGLVFQQNGAATEAPRVGEAGVAAVERAVAARVRSQAKTPGSESALRQLILGIQSGQPDYSALSPQLAAGTRVMLHHLQATLKPWGALRSIKFRGVDSKGWDRYIVRFQHGAASVGIALDAYGVVVGAGISAAPQAG